MRWCSLAICSAAHALMIDPQPELCGQCRSKRQLTSTAEAPSASPRRKLVSPPAAAVAGNCSQPRAVSPGRHTRLLKRAALGQPARGRERAGVSQERGGGGGWRGRAGKQKEARHGGCRDGRRAAWGRCRGDGCGRRPTRRCTGAAEAQFIWFSAMPFGGPVNAGVRHLCK